MTHEPEDFITVEEAAERLRIGRSRAYMEARLYIETCGAEGIVPAIPVGRLYRVSVARLEEIAGGPMRSFHRGNKRTGVATDTEATTNGPCRDDRADRTTPRVNGRPSSMAPRLFDS